MFLFICYSCVTVIFKILEINYTIVWQASTVYFLFLFLNLHIYLKETCVLEQKCKRVGALIEENGECLQLTAFWIRGINYFLNRRLTTAISDWAKSLSLPNVTRSAISLTPNYSIIQDAQRDSRLISMKDIHVNGCLIVRERNKKKVKMSSVKCRLMRTSILGYKELNCWCSRFLRN